jgi:D-amino peptidase
LKLFIMTDVEGVAGVLNFQEWVSPGMHYYDLARKLLTLEVNAAVEGFCEGGATEILVVDGHGSGGIDIELLDPRVEYQRGWGAGPWPLSLDETFDGLAFVGQHAKAGTPFGHMAHTQGLGYLDLSINGLSIGEFGQLAMCASELGVRTIFGCGDEAFTREAKELVPDIETVSVKKGVKPGSGDELTEEQYERFTASARHLHPIRARQLIRHGALRAIQRAKTKEFGIIPLQPPFEKVTRLRPSAKRPHKTISRVTHPSSVIAVMNLQGEAVPITD